MTAGQGAARRYARALLDLAPDEAAAEGLRGELAESAALLAAQAELRSVLAHPTVAPERKKKVVEAVWGRRGASGLLQRLLNLLVERGRIALLPAIEEAFARGWNARRGVVAAEAVTAVPLEAAQTGSLREALRRAAGQEVELKTSTDPRVMGGLLVRMAGLTYDGTVRSQLESLRSALGGSH